MPRCSRARPSRPGGPLYGGTMAAKSIAQPTQRPQRKQADHDCVPRVSDENQNEFAVVYTYSEARRKFASVLEIAQRDGAVRIRRKDGQSFILQPESSALPPLAIEGVDLGLTGADIVEIVREGRERYGWRNVRCGHRASRLEFILPRGRGVRRGHRRLRAPRRWGSGGPPPIAGAPIRGNRR